MRRRRRRDRLLPARWKRSRVVGVGHRQQGDRGEVDLAELTLVPRPVILAGALLDLHEAHPHRQHRPGARIGDHLGGQPRPLRRLGDGVGRRHDDAELPANLVLGCRRPVRVEQVPLVEDGVGDGASVGEPVGHGVVGHHGSPASLNSCSRA